MNDAALPKLSSLPGRERFESWSVLYKVHENGFSMTFTIVPHMGEDGDTFHRTGALGGPDPTSDIDEAQVFAHGYIKWDGCADFDVGDNREHSFRHHTCGRRHMALCGRMLDSVYDVAARVIPRWDHVQDEE